MNKRIPKLCALPAGIGLLTVGCSDGIGDLQTYVYDLERKPTQRVPDVRTPTAYPDLGYAPEALRNPFAAHGKPEDQAAKKTKTAAADTDRIREPLEQFSLDALTLVGTLRQAGVSWALIRTPDGEVRRVTVGNYLGRNHGRILMVGETGLTLREWVTDDRDGQRQRTIEFNMPERPGSDARGPES